MRGTDMVVKKLKKTKERRKEARRRQSQYLTETNEK